LNQAEGTFPAGASPVPDPGNSESTQREKRKERTVNPLIQLKTTLRLLITLTLLCFGFLPKAEAVVPPPVADAHRGDGKRFVVHADEKLAAFLELEAAICPCDELA
jgi:hypothetical protein